MSILNRESDGLLSALIALCRALHAYGPQPEDALLRLVAPTTAVQGKRNLAGKTLTRWKQLGFFVEGHGQIRLSDQIASISADDLDALRAAVLKLVLQATNNPGLDREADSADEKSKASDCTHAMAWALAQDPYDFPTGYKDAEALQDEQGVIPRPFTNDTRWPAFLEWATFLGVGLKTARVGFVPVPSFAVQAVLPLVFGDVRVLAQGDFFERLAESLPIVDGGSLRLQLATQSTQPWRTESGTDVSPSLSAALLTLESSGVLRLEERSDAPQRMLLGRGGRPLHRLSHIERLEDA